MAAHALVPEFTLGGEEYFRDRLADKTSLSLIMWEGETMAGYAASYLESDAVYIWLAGTALEYRTGHHGREWQGCLGGRDLRTYPAMGFSAGIGESPSQDDQFAPSNAEVAGEERLHVRRQRAGRDANGKQDHCRKAALVLVRAYRPDPEEYKFRGSGQISSHLNDRRWKSSLDAEDTRGRPDCV